MPKSLSGLAGRVPAWRVRACRILAGCVLAAALSACGGGGGGGGGGIVTPPIVTGPTWQQGVYQPSVNYQNRCAAVRTGVDAEGRAFPDQAGTLQHELLFLRSWTNETYLWRTEVADQNPSGFVDKTIYFDTLKTTQLSTSGRPKDQFHFSMLTADYLAQVTSAPTASYGAEIRIFSGTVPRDVRVLYTQAGTPAAELLAGTPKLSRGARLLTVDGVDVINAQGQAAVDILNNGTFPRAAGETHTLTVRYPDNTTRSITLTSANISETPVNRTAVIPTATGNVGYILLNTFGADSAEKAAADAVAAMKAQNVTDIVLDLRYNGGGFLAIASQLSHMMAGPTRTTGKVFERLLFNNFPSTTNPVTGGTNTPTPFVNTGVGFSLANGATLQTLDLPRVFVLSTASTCSASEAVINGLRGIDVDVVQIGGKTCGKPYGFYAEDNCGRTYFSIQFQGINEKSFGDYADGFVPANASSTFGVKVPGCSVADDFNHELGDASEAMLSAALNYRLTTTCPAPNGTSLAPARVRGDGSEMANPNRTEAQDFLRSSRDMRMPAKTTP